MQTGRYNELTMMTKSYRREKSARKGGVRWVTVKDKLLLVLVAVLVFGVSILSQIFRDKYYSEAWSDFILANIFYLIFLIAAIFTFEPFKRLPKMRQILFQIVFYLITAGAAFTLLFSRLVPFPSNILVYTVSIVILSVASTGVLDYALRKWRRIIIGK